MFRCVQIRIPHQSIHRIPHSLSSHRRRRRSWWPPPAPPSPRPPPLLLPLFIVAILQTQRRESLILENPLQHLVSDGMKIYNMVEPIYISDSLNIFLLSVAIPTNKHIGCGDKKKSCLKIVHFTLNLQGCCIREKGCNSQRHYMFNFNLYCPLYCIFNTPFHVLKQY